MQKISFLLLIILWFHTISGQIVRRIDGKTPVGFEKEVNNFLIADSASFPKTGGYLFVGSSTFRMWNNMQDYFPEIRLLQRGFGGSNMAALLYYTPYIVLPYKPDTIVVYEGDNDLAQHVSPKAFVASCDTFLRIIHKNLPGTVVYFVSVKPSPSRLAILPMQNEANSLLKKMLKHRKWTGFIDIRPAMYDSSGKIKGELFLKDSLHITGQCYRLWADEIKRQMHIKRDVLDK